LQDIGFKAFNCHYPAQLASKVAILSLGEDILQRLSVRQPNRFGSSGSMDKFLLCRRPWEAGFNPANAIDIAWGGGCFAVSGRRQSNLVVRKIKQQSRHVTSRKHERYPKVLSLLYGELWKEIEQAINDDKVHICGVMETCAVM
jgi:hypothetical protein